MDTARQFLRWSIPGSTLLMILALAVSANDVVARYFGLRGNIQAPLTAPEVALATLLSIPIGFLVYQHYYRFEFRVSRSGIGTRDRGWDVIQKVLVPAVLLIEKPPLLEDKTSPFLPSDEPSEVSHLLYPALTLHMFGVRVRTLQSEESKFRRRVLVPRGWAQADTHEQRRKIRRDFARDSKTRWRLVRMLIVLLADGERGKALASEYTALSDIYHTLGACRTAVFIGGALSVPASFLLGGEHDPWARFSVGYSVALACIPLYFTLWRNREQVQDHLLASLQVGISACAAKQGAIP